MADQTVTPYLVIAGAAKAIDFYKDAFGAVELTRMADGARIGHAELRIGDSRIMLADEYPEQKIVGPRALGGSPVRLQVETHDVDAVAAKAAKGGAKILQPPKDQPYGERNTKIEDPFGHVWIFSAPIGKPGVRATPEGYHTVTPYLVVKNVAGVIEFAKKAFAAREKFRSARPDGSIQHAEIVVGDSVVMLGEASGEFLPRPSTLSLYVEDVDAAYRRAVQAGGKSLREPATQFYGDRSAGVEDPGGNQWWVATHVEDVSPEEIERRSKAAAQGGGK